MYKTPKQKKRYVITAIAVALSTPLVLLAIYAGTQLLSEASGDVTPTQIAITNFTTSSVSITWLTEKDSIGQVVAMNPDGTETAAFSSQREGSRKTHYVDLVSLEPDTEYTFKIISNGEEFTTDDNKFRTLPLSPGASAFPDPVFGSIAASDTDVIIFATTAGAYAISAVPSDNGNWSVFLDLFHSTADQERIEYDESTTISITILGAGAQGATVTGTIGELFDDDDVFVSDDQLDLTGAVNLTALLPAQSIPGGIVAGGTDDGATDGANTGGASSSGGSTATGGSTTTGGGTTGNQQPPEEPEPEPEPEDEFDPSTREFLLASDVAWKDLVLGTSTEVGTPDVVVGESSMEIVNLTDTSFTVVWVTEDTVSGSIAYGTDPADLSSSAVDLRDGLDAQSAYNTHFIEVTDLIPDTTYYFEVTSGTEVFGTDDPYVVTTFSTLADPPPSDTIEGVITGEGLSDVSDAVVLATIVDKADPGNLVYSNTRAVLPDSAGGWLLSLGDARTPIGTYFTIGDEDEINLELLAYTDSEPVIASGADYATSSYDLVAEVSTGGVVAGAVPTVDDYGVFVDPVGVGGGGPTTYYRDGTTTPQTSISTPLFIGAVTGGVAILGSIYIYTSGRSVRPSRSKSGMTDRV